MWPATQRWTKGFMARRIFSSRADEDPIPPSEVRQQTATIPNAKHETGELSVFTARALSRADGEDLDDNGAPIPGNYTRETLDLLTMVEEDKTIEVNEDGDGGSNAKTVSKRVYKYHTGPIDKWSDRIQGELEPWGSLRAVPNEIAEEVGHDV
jgi:hypothetical protein